MPYAKLLNKDIVDKFISQISEHEFFDAHETLEELWFEQRFEKNSRIRLLRALINGAVSLELTKRLRPEPSLRVWKYFLNNIYLVDEIYVDERDMFKSIIAGLQKIDKEYR